MSSWFCQRRQEWIGETLRIFGFIQRAHLMRKFGISMPQASADLQKFKAANRNMMVYDEHAKQYVYCGKLE
jgi:hypothetical protein